MKRRRILLILILLVITGIIITVITKISDKNSAKQLTQYNMFQMKECYHKKVKVIAFWNKNFLEDSEADKNHPEYEEGAAINDFNYYNQKLLPYLDENKRIPFSIKQTQDKGFGYHIFIDGKKHTVNGVYTGVDLIQTVNKFCTTHSTEMFLNYEPIFIPDFAKKYIRSHFGGFQFPKVSLSYDMKVYFLKEGKPIRPWSITLDFNGDKQKDWAGLLERKNGILDVVVIYSKGGKYSHSILRENVGRNSSYIHMGVYSEPAGTIQGFPFGMSEKDRIAKLNYTGVHLKFFETSSVLYSWEEDKIHELWTSD